MQKKFNFFVLYSLLFFFNSLSMNFKAKEEEALESKNNKVKEGCKKNRQYLDCFATLIYCNKSSVDSEHREFFNVRAFGVGDEDREYKKYIDFLKKNKVFRKKKETLESGSETSLESTRSIDCDKSGSNLNKNNSNIEDSKSLSNNLSESLFRLSAKGLNPFNEYVPAFYEGDDSAKVSFGEAASEIVCLKNSKYQFFVFGENSFKFSERISDDVLFYDKVDGKITDIGVTVGFEYADQSCRDLCLPEVVFLAFIPSMTQNKKEVRLYSKKDDVVFQEFILSEDNILGYKIFKFKEFRLFLLALESMVYYKNIEDNKGKENIDIISKKMGKIIIFRIKSLYERNLALKSKNFKEDKVFEKSFDLCQKNNALKKLEIFYGDEEVIIHANRSEWQISARKNK